MLMWLCSQEVTKDQFGTLARNNPLGFLSLLQVMPKEASLYFERPSRGDVFTLFSIAVRLAGAAGVPESIWSKSARGDRPGIKVVDDVT